MADYLSGIETTEEGYLLFPGHEDQVNRNPIVLESVEQLWLKFHPHCNQIEFDPDGGESTPSPLEELTRFHDMSNMIMPVIEDIDKMRDQQRFFNRDQRQERQNRIFIAETTSQGKINSLEREQEARQKMNGELQLEEATSISSNEVQVQMQVQVDYSIATLRVVKTMNSIRLIYPILIKLLTHECCKDKKLTIGKQSIVGKDSKNNKQWMLGDYVFDIGTNKNVATIRTIMSHVLRALLSREEIANVLEGTVEWKTLVSQLTAKSQIPDSVPNPLQLLQLNDDLLNRAQHHDAALMQYIHEGGQNQSHDSFSQAVGNLKRKLDTVLGGRFQGSRLEVYGSCLSDLSIGKASDVDVSIHIPALRDAKNKFERGQIDAKKYDNEVKRHVYAVSGRLGDFRRDFFNTQPVARARVPVIKGSYRFAQNPHTSDGSLCFDICFFNDIAVRNSTLLRDYTEVSPQSKNLMLAVKKWVKDKKICSAADERLSSYAWMVLVVFYLQQIGLLPNLQCPELMKQASFEPDA